MKTKALIISILIIVVVSVTIFIYSDFGKTGSESNSGGIDILPSRSQSISDETYENGGVGDITDIDVTPSFSQSIPDNILPETIGTYNRRGSVSATLAIKRVLVEEGNQVYKVYSYKKSDKPSDTVGVIILGKDEDILSSLDGPPFFNRDAVHTTIKVGDFEVVRAGSVDMYWFTEGGLFIYLPLVVSVGDVVVEYTDTGELIYTWTGGEGRIQFVEELIRLSMYDREATQAFQQEAAR